MTKGKFIVFYGINRLGKTTQSEIVSREIEVRNSVDVLRIKYPVYDLEPTGPRINAYLRKRNPENLTPFQHQVLQLQNRFGYQPTLIERLESGLWVLAEDYVLTGIAWGVATGVNESWLKRETKKLLKEDLGILFDGKQFPYKEEGHIYENDGELTERCREIHLRLAQEFNIPIINANPLKEQVTRDILNILIQRGFIR